MGVALNIGLDLGGDTLKVSYSYNHKGKVHYGKLYSGEYTDQTGQIRSSRKHHAYPALAYYNKKNNTWVFGNDIDGLETEDYTTLVKIKLLLSLLYITGNKNLDEKNYGYFSNNTLFPYFFFPIKQNKITDFDKLVEKDLVFDSTELTPYDVVAHYFIYIRVSISECIKKMIKETGVEFSHLSFSMVYPADAHARMTKVLREIVEAVFGMKLKCFMPTTKALSYLTHYFNLSKENEKVLIFDMGEENVSVTGAKYETRNGKFAMSIDSVEGHSEPLSIGGNQLDESIFNYFSESIENKETMGTASAGSADHIYEKSVSADDYKLMSDIKTAKLSLSYVLSEAANGNIFFSIKERQRVPIGLSRDLYIQRDLNEDNFANLLGTKNDKGIANQIFEYIQDEISDKNMLGATTVFLTGGLVESPTLFDYLSKKIHIYNSKINVNKLAVKVDKENMYYITSAESSEYASSLAISLVGLNNPEFLTIFSLTYGTYANDKTARCLVFVPLFYKGDIVDNEHNTASISLNFRHFDNGKDYIEEGFYSLAFSQNELKSRYLADKLSYVGTNLEIENLDATKNPKLIKYANFKSSARGRIYLYINNKKIKEFNKDDLTYRIFEGLKMDNDGRSAPFIKFDLEHSPKNVTVVLEGSNRVITVHLEDIEARFDGINPFSTQ